jgi:hypothetical protein
VGQAVEGQKQIKLLRDDCRCSFSVVGKYCLLNKVRSFSRNLSVGWLRVVTVSCGKSCLQYARRRRRRENQAPLNLQ